jgi:hypothetical protein
MMFWWLGPQCTSLFLKTKHNRWRVKLFLPFTYISGIFLGLLVLTAQLILLDTFTAAFHEKA